MSQTIEAVRGPGKRRTKSSDREPLNWLPKLKFFANDFFLAAASLLILKNFTKGTQLSMRVLVSRFVLI